MDKIKLEFTQDELDLILDCMCGTYSCPKEYVDLINYVAKYSRGKGVYCPDSL